MYGTNNLTIVFHIVGWRRGTPVTLSMPRLPVVGGCDTWISVYILGGYGPPAP